MTAKEQENAQPAMAKELKHAQPVMEAEELEEVTKKSLTGTNTLTTTKQADLEEHAPIAEAPEYTKKEAC